jgi:P-type E1-E2 ATPase
VQARAVRKEKRMISIDIPGCDVLNLEHLVLDFNGTLAVDGRLLNGLAPRIAQLADQLDVHVVTGNTYGDARTQLRACRTEVVCVPPYKQAEAKRDYVVRLGAGRVAAVGNGRNDALMLRQAALGIAVLGTEGLAGDTLEAADIVVRHAVDALGLMLFPKRLVAVLRR